LLGVHDSDTQGLGSCGVAQQRKLFHDPLHIFTLIPGLFDQYEGIIRSSFKQSVSREEFVELIESTGLDQHDLRKMRRAFPKLFHSEGACLEEKKELDKGADELLGPKVTIEPDVVACECNDRCAATVKEIKARLEGLGLPVQGLKQDLLERLRASDPNAFMKKCTCVKDCNQPLDMIDFTNALRALLPTALMAQLQPDDKEHQLQPKLGIFSVRSSTNQKKMAMGT